jgi:hypothetical protein
MATSGNTLSLCIFYGKHKFILHGNIKSDIFLCLSEMKQPLMSEDPSSEDPSN